MNKEDFSTASVEAPGGEPHSSGLGGLRTKRLKFAVITSIFSKIITVCVQLIAIPVAVNALGAERYGVFVTLTAVLAWISLANVGLEPGLTRGIALSAADGDLAREERYLSSSFFLVAGIASVLLTLLILVVWKAPVETLFGNEYAGFSSEIRWGLLLLGLLFVLKLVLSVIEAARAGYQEQYITNLCMSAGNALSIALLFVVASYWPTVAGMIVAVYGAVVLAQLLNGIHLLGFSRSYLMPRLGYFNLGLSKVLVGSGLALFLIYVSSFVNQQLSLFISGRELGPTSAASLAIMLRMSELLGGVIMMITFPLWPAITEAVARRDISWVRNSYRKIALYSTSYSVAAGVTVAIAGQTIVYLWIGPEVLPSVLLQVLVGLYFVLWSWAHVNHMTLIGLGWLWPTALMVLTESLIMIPLALWFMAWMGNAGLVAALCLSTTCFSIWLAPLMVKVAMQRAERLPQGDSQSL